MTTLKLITDTTFTPRTEKVRDLYNELSAWVFTAIDGAEFSEVEIALQRCLESVRDARIEGGHD